MACAYKVYLRCLLLLSTVAAYRQPNFASHLLFFFISLVFIPAVLRKCYPVIGGSCVGEIR
jgi:hypothetical protein